MTLGEAGAVAGTACVFRRASVVGLGCILLLAGCGGSPSEKQLIIHWDRITVADNTTPTLQVVVNPKLRPGQALDAAAY